MDSEISAKKAVTIVLSILIGIFVLLEIISMIRVVPVGQVGILTRFGNVVGEEPSGLHIINPWPFEHLIGMPIQLQKEQEEADASTLDLQNVTAQVALNYSVTPSQAKNIYKNIGSPDVYVENAIEPKLQAITKSVTSQYNASDLVDQRPKVEAELTTDVAQQLKPLGFTVDSVSIVNFSFSTAFTNAIEDKQVAAQKVATAQYNLQQAQVNAQANQVQSTSLTPQVLEQQAIAKWSGNMPQSIGSSSTVFGIPLQ